MNEYVYIYYIVQKGYRGTLKGVENFLVLNKKLQQGYKIIYKWEGMVMFPLHVVIIYSIYIFILRPSFVKKDKFTREQLKCLRYIMLKREESDNI